MRCRDAALAWAGLGAWRPRPVPPPCARGVGAPEKEYFFDSSNPGVERGNRNGIFTELSHQEMWPFAMDE